MAEKRELGWIRYRFLANLEDYRPVKWPALGPYWKSGEWDQFATMIAYIPRQESPVGTELLLRRYWPEAADLDIQERDEITFTERFPCPEWWDSENNSISSEFPEEPIRRLTRFQREPVI